MTPVRWIALSADISPIYSHFAFTLMAWIVSTQIGREKTLACVMSFGPMNLLYNLLGPNDVTHPSVLSLLIIDIPNLD